MLVLTRRRGEVITIGDEIRITVVKTGTHQIRLGIDAPSALSISREELASLLPADDSETTLEAA
jgi:carbon storage regulator